MLNGPEHTKASWVDDINNMHSKFGVHPIVSSFNREKLLAFLEFRIKFLDEELKELKVAFEEKNADDIVDALIDLSVISIGTLDLLEVDAELAWDQVFLANICKEPGIKASRPNPLGLPDLIKPEGWVPPSHADNIGLLSKISD